MLDLILTNEEMIDNLHVKDPLGLSVHCVTEFKSKCYFEQYNISKERWNNFKGNHEQMNKKLDLDWDKILIDINPNKQINIFLENFTKAKSECISKIKSKIYNKIKMHNYLPLDEKTIKKLKRTIQHDNYIWNQERGKNIGNM